MARNGLRQSNDYKSKQSIENLYSEKKTQKGLPVMYDYNGRRIDPKEARARVTDRLGNGSRSTDGKYGDN